MHHGTCVTHVPWRMSGSLSRGGVENVPGFPGACATRNFTYLARSPLCAMFKNRRMSLVLRAPLLRLSIVVTPKYNLWCNVCRHKTKTHDNWYLFRQRRRRSLDCRCTRRFWGYTCRPRNGTSPRNILEYQTWKHMSVIQNYFSQVLFYSVIFLQILPRVHSCGPSHGNMTYGMRDVWSPQRVSTG